MGDSSDEDVQKNKLTKKELQEIERRRLKNKKKKLSKKKKEVEVELDLEAEKDSGVDSAVTSDKERDKENDNIEDLGVEIEYVGEEPPITEESDPNYHLFENIFKAFKIEPPVEEAKLEVKETKKDEPSKPALIEKIHVEDMIEKSNDDDDEPKLSRRKLRAAMQPSIAVLKASTWRPDVVEWADVTSKDPYLLVQLKSHRNTVTVPRHWNAKRKYLAGKRGFERAPFQLPEFIVRTGIQDMREVLWEKDEQQNLKSKMRERARPKLGKINIDYQMLHDAFFKWQTKPFMTQMGELYYEGKEVETLMRDKKPGILSDDLRIALGMPVGPNAHKFPPPWLIAMQRYGPPPSYPNLKVSGLNAPIPEGCSFGYHAGGWGKPPVDDLGRPLYGDVFGVDTSSAADEEAEEQMEKRYWGEIGSDDSEEEEESEDEEEDEDDLDGMATQVTEGLATPSGTTTGITGLETPESIELRKGRRTEESAAGVDTPAAAYHIIPEKRTDRVGGQMMASTHVYDLSKKQGVRDDGVEVSLDPDSIDLDQNKLQEKYEEQLRKQTRSDDHEDLSDMVAAHVTQQNRKRKVQETKKVKDQQGTGTAKKYKDFTF